MATACPKSSGATLAQSASSVAAPPVRFLGAPRSLRPSLNIRSASVQRHVDFPSTDSQMPRAVGLNVYFTRTRNAYL